MTEDKVPESLVGYVLIGGLLLSVVVEIIGLAAYYLQSGSFALTFTPPSQMTGQNFFAYAISILSLVFSAQSPVAIMALGIVLLMLTSYARVVVTLIHFAFAKNAKYTAISLFLTVVLALTLLVH